MCLGLFCLLFLAGGLPILEALTPGLGAGRSFEFVNDPSDALQKVDERSQQGADNNTPGSNQGDKDGIGHNLDRESLLQGMGWAMAFSVGFLVGSWLGAKLGVWLAYALPLGNVFQQNAPCPPTGATEKEVEK